MNTVLVNPRQLIDSVRLWKAQVDARGAAALILSDEDRRLYLAVVRYEEKLRTGGKRNGST